MYSYQFTHSAMPIVELNCDLWSHPIQSVVPTEKQSHLLLKNGALPVCNPYLAIPWSYLINFKSYDLLPKLSFEGAFTICQHYRYKEILPILKQMGCKYLFSTHAPFSSYIDEGIHILSFPHFAANALTGGALKDILFSFVGAFYTHPQRKSFRSFQELENVVIRERVNWHFQRDIYKPNCMSQEDQLLEREEYKNILSRSRFALCPEGIGPGTIRFWEALSAGAIPILISDRSPLPILNGHDWSKCILQVSSQDIEKIPVILESVTEAQEHELRRNALLAYDKFSGVNLVSCVRDFFKNQADVLSAKFAMGA